MTTLAIDASSRPAGRVWQLLEGRWEMKRSVEPGGCFVGIATFTKIAEDTLLYHEAGDLVIADGTRLASERRYAYVLQGDVLEVRFHDGGEVGDHFVDLLFPTAVGSDGAVAFPIESGDTHLCRLDRYEARFRFESATRFSITYVVSGPRKDYVSKSDYRRAV